MRSITVHHTRRINGFVYIYTDETTVDTCILDLFSVHFVSGTQLEVLSAGSIIDLQFNNISDRNLFLRQVKIDVTDL